MARIRTIKPEFCTSEQVAECSTTARLLFVTMWCFCDDAGRHPASAKRLKMECFPADSFTDDEMLGFIGELVGAGLLIEYEHNSKRYWQVTGWHHQKIDKPSYKYGPIGANGIPLPVGNHSANGSRTLGDSSPPESSLAESSLRESTSAAASAIRRGVGESAAAWAAAAFENLDFEECQKLAEKLYKSRPGREQPAVWKRFCWAVVVLGQSIRPGLAADWIQAVSGGKVEKVRRWLEAALRNESDSLGFTLKELLDIVDRAWPEQIVEKANS